MDRLRKRLEEFRLKVRKFVRHNWHNDPEGNVFRSLDILFVIGAVRYNSTQQWKRTCWNAYRAVSVFIFVFFVLNFLDAVHEPFDVVKITWHSIVVSITILCFLKDAILNRNFESMQTTRNFIKGKPFGSGDAPYDSACRKKLFQRIQLTVLSIGVAVLIDEFIFNFPNSGIDELVGTPQALLHLGPVVARKIHICVIFCISPIWLIKYSTGTITICSLLYGFKTEYGIFVGGFEKILDNVYSDVEQKLPSTFRAAPEWIRYHRDRLFWKCLKQRVIDQAKLHVQLVENMQLLQPIVKNIFGIIYYDAMITFSPLIYMVWLNGASLSSVCLVVSSVVNLLECYGWCSIIESFYDINQSLEREIMHLMTRIPHSELHHKKYVEIRAMLCTMKIFVQNNEPFSCGGVFSITVEAFTELLNIGYTVFTFLRDMGKKY